MDDFNYVKISSNLSLYLKVNFIVKILIHVFIFTKILKIINKEK